LSCSSPPRLRRGREADAPDRPRPARPRRPLADLQAGLGCPRSGTCCATRPPSAPSTTIAARRSRATVPAAQDPLPRAPARGADPDPGAGDRRPRHLRLRPAREPGQLQVEPTRSGPGPGCFAASSSAATSASASIRRSETTRGPGAPGPRRPRPRCTPRAGRRPQLYEAVVLARPRRLTAAR
jgi:hypothetical protein